MRKELLAVVLRVGDLHLQHQVGWLWARGTATTRNTAILRKHTKPFMLSHSCLAAPSNSHDPARAHSLSLVDTNEGTERIGTLGAQLDGRPRKGTATRAYLRLAPPG